jgi:SnoaL-like domain
MLVTEDRARLTARSALLYNLYADAVDRNDLDTLRQLATDDVRITRGGKAEPGGIEAFLDIYRAHINRSFQVCQHAVTNVIASSDGDLIRTSAYFQARLFSEQGTQTLIGRYADDHVEVDGGLKIAHKNIQVLKVMDAPPGHDVFAYAGTD